MRFRPTAVIQAQVIACGIAKHVEEELTYSPRSALPWSANPAHRIRPLTLARKAPVQEPSHFAFHM